MSENVLRQIALTVLREHRQRTFQAIRCLWRTGDAVRELRDSSRARSWRRALERCAHEVGVHPASLDEAFRASAGFPLAAREALLARFEQSGVVLTPSHVVELARQPPRKRTQGIEMLLAVPHSIRQLRACLRAEFCDCHRIHDAVDAVSRHPRRPLVDSVESKTQ